MDLKNSSDIYVNFFDFNNNILDISIRYVVQLNSTCYDCPFFTGERVHGHGDYWGNCLLIKKLDSNYYNSICFNDTICLLKRHLKSEEK